MIEMHWVIFMLALLVCGAGGWMVRGGCDRRRREEEKENEEILERWGESCAKHSTEPDEVVTLNRDFHLTREELANLKGAAAWQMVSRQAAYQFYAEEIRDLIEIRASYDPLRDVMEYRTFLRVLRPVGGEKMQGYRMKNWMYSLRGRGQIRMPPCCLSCRHIEHRENYVYPWRCLLEKGERLSAEERLLKAEILSRCTPLLALPYEMRNRIVREYMAYD